MPISLSCPACRAAFRLADTMAGKQVRCSKCASILQVPQLTAPQEPEPTQIDVPDRAREAIQDAARPIAAGHAPAVSEPPHPQDDAEERTPRRRTAPRPVPDLRAERTTPAFVWLVPVVFACLFLLLGVIGAVVMSANRNARNNFGWQNNPPMPAKAWRAQKAFRDMPKGGFDVDKKEDIGIPADQGNTIKIGILHSLTGTMANNEKSLKDAELLAIEEINKAGGVLGRRLEAIVEDPQSKFDTLFPDKAEKLLLQDKVAAVFGCWTSVSRRNVLPIFEQHNGLLFYAVPYEGNESSRNVIYSGAAPNQQILPAVDWLLSQQGGAKKKFYLIGSDYVFPRTANLIIVKYLESHRLRPVAEEYSPLGHLDYSSVVQKIKAAGADVIVSTINGDGNVNFFNELAAQGITPDKVPVVSVNIGEVELCGLDPSKVKGHLAARNYVQSIDTPANKAFVKRFQDKYGKDRVTDDPIAAAYAQVYLWKSAVEKAGSTDVDKVREAFIKGGPIGFDAPEGKILVSPKSLHVHKAFHMGKMRNDRQFDIIYSTPAIEPDPYPQIAFPGWSVDWTKGGLIKGGIIRIPR